MVWSWLFAGLVWGADRQVPVEALTWAQQRGVSGDPVVVPHGKQGERGTTVRFVPHVDGIPVDVSSVVWLGPDGRVRASRVAPELPIASSGPLLPMQQAKALALQRFPAARAHARLSYRPMGGLLRRLWSVHLEQPATVGMTAPIIRLDASTGAVVLVEEGAEHGHPRALAYPRNPTLDPDPTLVTLPGAVEGLSDGRMEVFQCSDQGEVAYTYGADDEMYELRTCTNVPAPGPVGGDYLYEPVPWPEEPGLDEDDFLLPNLYWNVHRGLDWFDALGWIPAENYDPRVVVVGNLRTTDMWSIETAASGALAPYNNAYHRRGYQEWLGDWIPPELVFGQGTDADFGYDADVTMHELGHLIVSSQHGPSYSLDTELGPSIEANALNEGIADYFSSAIQGDPLLAEYIVAERELGSESIRDLSDEDTCGADLYGESHYDGQPFAQGLWAFRETLSGPEQTELDRALLDSLSVLGQNASFEDAFEVIPAAVDDLLGLEAGEALRRLWRERGFDRCDPILDVTPSADEPFRSFSLVPYFSEWGYKRRVPGYIQFRVQIDEPGSTVTLRAQQSQYLGLDLWDQNEPQPVEVIGGFADRITWTHELVEAELEYEGDTHIVAVTRWRHDAELLGSLERVDTQPHEDRPDTYLSHDYELTLMPEGTGTFVFQFANTAERSVTLTDLGITVEGPEPEVTTPATPQTPTEEPRACGCAAPAGSAGWLWAPLLVLLGQRRSRAR